MPICSPRWRLAQEQLESHREKPELIRRFVEEAQIGGQLQHPGIVPIYELGAFADRRPYFAMKLVNGRTLSSLLDERSFDAVSPCRSRLRPAIRSVVLIRIAVVAIRLAS